MPDLTEHPLSGGHETPGIVRVGDTVRRPLHSRSEYVHAVLGHLEAVGFAGSPRFLGIDDQGREMLSYFAGELGPHNMVFDGDAAVGIIDWDDAVAPGPRLIDFGHAVWCCADVCEESVDVAEQARKIRLLCIAYGDFDPDAVVDEIAARFRRARDAHIAHGRDGAVPIFEDMMAWMQRHGPSLKGQQTYIGL